MKYSACRICGCGELAPVLDLGEHCLTGYFLASPKENLPRESLAIAKCPECHLLQLQHEFDIDKLYGEHYGYCSSLNASMVSHLKEKIAALIKICPLVKGDIVLDIGSNDGTSLSFYPSDVLPVGFDPSSEKFKHLYRKDALLVVDFFNSDSFRRELGEKKAKIITSIAMFYDLPKPFEFALQIKEVLAEDGIWHFEQSYMPAMLRTNSYDTICHEHLEYYALGQIKHILDRSGLKIIAIEFNNINGGSFAVTAAHKASSYKESVNSVSQILAEENRLSLNTLTPYIKFKERTFKHRDSVKKLFEQMKQEGRLVLGYGASTKGNVLLQFCGLGPAEMPAIAEVNSFKFGKYTPGTLIPIVSEEEAKKMGPDAFFVLPWHFREHILERESRFLHDGGKLLFPLPNIAVVGS